MNENMVFKIYVASLVGFLLFQPAWLPMLGIVIFLLLVAVWDWKWQRIPNWITYPTMATGLLYHTLTAREDGLITAILGLLLGGALYLPGYLLGKMGAGDVKGLAAIGAILGPAAVFHLFLTAAILGGVIVIGLSMIRGSLLDVTVSGQMIGLPALTHYFFNRRQIPYGVVLSLGGLLWMIFEKIA